MVSARSVRNRGRERSPFLCASEYIIVLFLAERSVERAEPERPGWLSLAHLLDAIQSMWGLDLVPPPRTTPASVRIL